jgi:hypothetical protein
VVRDAAIDYGQIQAVVAAMGPVLCRRLTLDCLLLCSMVAVAVPRKLGSCSTSDERLPVPAPEGTYEVVVEDDHPCSVLESDALS